MENRENIHPIFSHAEPVLAVRDINETITYWQDVLGFPTKWTWGEPPAHGAVSWHNLLSSSLLILNSPLLQKEILFG